MALGSIRINFENGDQLGRKFKNKVQDFSTRRSAAVVATAKRAATEIESQGRQDIRAAGNFRSDRWQKGFRAKISYEAKNVINIRVTHAVTYWKIFQFGGEIKGQPMLWIPLDFAADAKGLRARDYPGGLFRIDREGKAPLLLNSDTGEPKYFGKESVTMPKKFHLVEIAQQVSRQLNAYFREEMKRGR